MKAWIVKAVNSLTWLLRSVIVPAWTLLRHAVQGSIRLSAFFAWRRE